MTNNSLCHFLKEIVKNQNTRTSNYKITASSVEKESIFALKDREIDQSYVNQLKRNKELLTECSAKRSAEFSEKNTKKKKINKQHIEIKAKL